MKTKCRFTWFGVLMQNKIHWRTAAVVLNAHDNLIAGRFSPIIILAFARHIADNFLETNEECNAFTLDITLFNAAFRSQEIRRTEQLVPFRLEQKHFYIFVAPTVFDFARPRAGDGSRSLAR